MSHPFVRYLAAATLLAALGAHLAVRAGVARAELVLNEVLYDPDGPDEEAEFVELWNPDPQPRSLLGITIEGADGARPDSWTVLFRGSAADSIGSASPFLIDGRSLSGSMQNGPDAVRLARDGITLDLLGYGDVAHGLAEGVASADAPSGSSLARREDGADHDRNAEDWEVEASPTPGRANHPATRLVLAAGSLSLDPVVPWPEEPVEAQAVVVNRGREALDGARWRALLETERIDSVGAVPTPASAVALAGRSLAPGESATVRLSFRAGLDGPFRARLRTAAATLPDLAELSDTLVAVGRVGAGPVVVTEIAFRDAGAGEWVEIWARDLVPDIGGLALADAGSSGRAIDRGAAPRAVAPGSYLVLAQDPVAVRSRYGLDSSSVLGVLGGWPSLNDANGSSGWADRVRIGEAGGIPCDVVPYDARAVSRGGTLERLAPDLPAHHPGSWGECVDRSGATPARSNSLRAPTGAPGRRGALLVASARILRRDRAGEGPLLLRLTPEARGRSLAVRVVDLVGHPVRTLLRGQRFASEGAFTWDGLDDAGAPAPPGLYVITAEAEPESGRGPRRSALPVAIVRGAR